MITILVAGRKVLIDRENAPLLANYYLGFAGTGYVRCSLLGAKNRGRGVYLHRLVTGAPQGSDIDHINHNKSDNRKNNLRIVSRSENMHNPSGSPKNYWYEKNRNRYIVEFRVGGKKESKWFKKEEDARQFATKRRSELRSLPRELNRKRTK